MLPAVAHIADCAFKFLLDPAGCADRLSFFDYEQFKHPGARACVCALFSSGFAVISSAGDVSLTQPLAEERNSQGRTATLLTSWLCEMRRRWRQCAWRGLVCSFFN